MSTHTAPHPLCPAQAHQRLLKERREEEAQLSPVYSSEEEEEEEEEEAEGDAAALTAAAPAGAAAPAAPPTAAAGGPAPSHPPGAGMGAVPISAAALARKREELLRVSGVLGVLFAVAAGWVQPLQCPLLCIRHRCCIRRPARCSRLGCLDAAATAALCARSCAPSVGCPPSCPAPNNMRAPLHAPPAGDAGALPVRGGQCVCGLCGHRPRHAAG